MKKSLHIILALCIGLMIGLSTTALGATKEFVQASFEKFNFIVNGEIVELDADPLVYQDSTYLPVRSMLNALGYDVGYLADSRTITADKSIGSSEQTKSEEDVMEEETTTNDESITDKINWYKNVIETDKRTLKSIQDANFSEDRINSLMEIIATNQQALADLEAQLE